MSNLVDITHTVKASRQHGHKLMKDLDTGELHWIAPEGTLLTQPEEVEMAFATPALTGATTEYLEAKPKKVKRKPSMQD
jgi:hypothetical protein